MRGQGGGFQLTSTSAIADGFVSRVLAVAADVPDLCVEQALAGEVLAVEVLGAPEAAGGNGAALGAVGDGGHGAWGVGGHGEAGGLGEGTGDAGEEAREHFLAGCACASRRGSRWRGLFGAFDGGLRAVVSCATLWQVRASGS